MLQPLPNKNTQKPSKFLFSFPLPYHSLHPLSFLCIKSAQNSFFLLKMHYFQVELKSTFKLPASRKAKYSETTSELRGTLNQIHISWNTIRLKGDHPWRAVRTTVLTHDVEKRVALPGAQEEDVNPSAHQHVWFPTCNSFGNTKKDMDAT